MKSGFYILLFCLLCVVPKVARAQCCSAGNPVGGTANVGVQDVRNFRMLLFQRHSYSDTYYEGRSRAELQGTTAGYYYLGTALAYGITDKLTVEAEMGVFLDKRKSSQGLPSERTSGLTNGTLSLKYGLWKDRLRDWELTAGAGLRFPFSKKMVLDQFGFPISMDVQPSTGAFGFVGQIFLYKGFMKPGWRFFLLHRYETNAVNNINYQYGDAFTTAFFVSKRLDLHWTGILQLRNEYRKIDVWEGVDLNSTGGDVVTLSPQINYLIGQKWNISLLVDVPVYKKYNLAQLGPKYAFAFNVMRNFAPVKKGAVGRP